MRPRGLQLIITYKLVKAPVMLVLAALLIFRADVSQHFVEHWSFELASGGGYLHSIGLWLQAHLGIRVLRGARWVALADGLLTSLEAILLLSGKSWGEWLVVAGVSALIPAEILSLIHRFSGVKVLVLLTNLAVAGYLLFRRLRSLEQHRQASLHAASATRSDP